MSDRYIVKFGRFGAYFFDTKFDKDMDLDEVKWILNQFELRINDADNNILEFLDDLFYDDLVDVWCLSRKDYEKWQEELKRL